MKESSDLLVEIGTEELPPRSLQNLAAALAANVRGGLQKSGLECGSVRWFATPRRLAVWIEEVAAEQPQQSVERRGPALSAAFSGDRKPTAAALGFARSCGVEVDSLDTMENDKGAWLVFRTVNPGQRTIDLLPDILATALASLPVGKRMRWGEGTEEFVRPVHWVLVLLGKQTVPCQLLGVKAGHSTRGHRFHHPGEIDILEPCEYAIKLQEVGQVIVDFDARRRMIRQMAEEAARKAGGTAHIDADLLDEITALVEWPVAITGSFDESFLELPPEVLIATMQMHQKYFPVRADAVAGQSGESVGLRLLPAFITIANIESTSPDAISKGNERVIRPRLTDAAFFWKRDTSRGLESYRAGLNHVVYQQSLGSLADKTQRLSLLCGHICSALDIDASASMRAALLSKCDLLTEMVGEFPELQGVMGYHYALKGGESVEIARAINEQYMPRQAGGQLPESMAGKILAIADKLDSLVGIFVIGQAPTGDSDPFGLRRAGLGCLRIMIESGLDLDLLDCLASAAGFYGELASDRDTVVENVFNFMMERLRRYYLDGGVTADVFEAVLAVGPSVPLDINLRIHAVSGFRDLPDAGSLAAANKRIRNILKQTAAEMPATIDTGLLTEAAERNLVSELEQRMAEIQPLLQARDYPGTLSILAAMRGAIDDFFDQVLVMSDNPAVRRNRLVILDRVSGLFRSVADISRLQA